MFLPPGEGPSRCLMMENSHAAQGHCHRSSGKDSPRSMQGGAGINLRGLMGPAIAKMGGWSEGSRPPYKYSSTYNGVTSQEIQCKLKIRHKCVRYTEPTRLHSLS